MELEHNETKEEIFQIKKWNAVALWSWDIQIDTCAICKNLVQDPCIECQSRNDTKTPVECQVAWGACKHTYHFHCISKWIKNRPVCPLDNKEWEFQKL